MGRVTYIVAATPRSGSTLLVEGLEATGFAGRPTEVFSPLTRVEWENAWSLPRDCPFDRYLGAALSYGTTPNGVYGLKIHWEHVPILARRLNVRGEPGQALDALYPDAAFIQIRRRDRQAQALSLFRALATGEWRRPAGEPPAETEDIALDPAAVFRLEGLIEQQEQEWERHLHERGIAPLTVEYERLAVDYRGELARVLAFLELDAAAAARLPEPRLTRQADALTERWRRQLEPAERAGSAA